MLKRVENIFSRYHLPKTNAYSVKGFALSHLLVKTERLQGERKRIGLSYQTDTAQTHGNFAIVCWFVRTYCITERYMHVLLRTAAACKNRCDQATDVAAYVGINSTAIILQGMLYVNEISLQSRRWTILSCTSFTSVLTYPVEIMLSSGVSKDGVLRRHFGTKQEKFKCSTPPRNKKTRYRCFEEVKSSEM